MTPSFAALRIAVLALIAFGLLACSPEAVVRRVQQARATPEAESGSEAMATPGTVEEAIQQVIARANAAQAEAIANRDPEPMRDTATDRYYREAQQINQELLDSGVTKIELVRIEWGPISVRGNTADATTWETWATTTRDGRTVQARDRNLYHLVLQEGAWKIQSNEHPDQQAPVPIPAPRQRPQI